MIVIPGKILPAFFMTRNPRTKTDTRLVGADLSFATMTILSTLNTAAPALHAIHIVVSGARKSGAIHSIITLSTSTPEQRFSQETLPASLQKGINRF